MASYPKTAVNERAGSGCAPASDIQSVGRRLAPKRDNPISVLPVAASASQSILSDRPRRRLNAGKIQYERLTTGASGWSLTANPVEPGSKMGPKRLETTTFVAMASIIRRADCLYSGESHRSEAPARAHTMRGSPPG